MSRRSDRMAERSLPQNTRSLLPVRSPRKFPESRTLRSGSPGKGANGFVALRSCTNRARAMVGEDLSGPAQRRKNSGGATVEHCGFDKTVTAGGVPRESRRSDRTGSGTGQRANRRDVGRPAAGYARPPADSRSNRRRRIVDRHRAFPQRRFADTDYRNLIGELVLRKNAQRRLRTIQSYALSSAAENVRSSGVPFANSNLVPRRNSHYLLSCVAAVIGWARPVFVN